MKSRVAYDRHLVARKPSLKVLGTAIVVGVGLLVGAGAIGWAIGNDTSSSDTSAQAPAGHAGGANLPVAEIGNASVGRELIVSKGCTDCHSFAGAGGSDAPPLDYMKGHLSATEIANMSGRIWNHFPQMLAHFEEEGIPVPTFEDDQMADLIAYLHSGEGGAPEVKDEGMMEGEGTTEK